MTLPEELRGNTEKEIVDTYLSRNAGKVWVPAVAVAAWIEAARKKLKVAEDALVADVKTCTKCVVIIPEMEKIICCGLHSGIKMGLMISSAVLGGGKGK